MVLSVFPRLLCSARALSLWPLPNTCSNEAGAVADELPRGRDVGFFVDGREFPEFEVVRRLGDGILVSLVVDGLGQGGHDLLVVGGNEGLHVVVDESVSDGVDFHDRSFPVVM